MIRPRILEYERRTKQFNSVKGHECVWWYELNRISSLGMDLAYTRLGILYLASDTQAESTTVLAFANGECRQISDLSITTSGCVDFR